MHIPVQAQHPAPLGCHPHDGPAPAPDARAGQQRHLNIRSPVGSGLEHEQRPRLGAARAGVEGEGRGLEAFETGGRRDGAQGFEGGGGVGSGRLIVVGGGGRRGGREAEGEGGALAVLLIWVCCVFGGGMVGWKVSGGPYSYGTTTANSTHLAQHDHAAARRRRGMHARHGPALEVLARAIGPLPQELALLFLFVFECVCCGTLVAFASIDPATDRARTHYTHTYYTQMHLTILCTHPGVQHRHEAVCVRHHRRRRAHVADKDLCCIVSLLVSGGRTLSIDQSIQPPKNTTPKNTPKPRTGADAGSDEASGVCHCSCPSRSRHAQQWRMLPLPLVVVEGSLSFLLRREVAM